MDLGFVSSGAVGLSSASSRVHSCAQRKAGDVSMSLSRRDVMKIAFAGVAAALVAPTAPVLADGAVSYGTRTRVRGLYGNKIIELQQDVDSLPELIENGNWNSVLKIVSTSSKKIGKIPEAKNAFQLYKTGYFADSRPKQALLTTHQQSITDACVSLELAAKKKDTAKATKAADSLQKAYTAYLTAGALSANDFIGEVGQSFSSDYDFRRKLP